MPKVKYSIVLNFMISKNKAKMQLNLKLSFLRALNMLFERHVAQNKGNLNESIMRMRLEELKTKLSIKS